eukprot:TRINITY_DN13606_c0_g1_i1.p1 TRINITY_DN13606_c0_g1~~TRINITY_DN13606_c0_g1_i1.p1  ORF type:complete len:278 (+),score=60.08 TRINITY_DN13606_c0_g1_i1:620-1453(+)
MCCYNGAEPPISSKNYMKAFEPGEYLDADISTDSRFIIVLPKHSQTVQIWFNHLYTLASANEAEENMKFGLASYSLEHDAEVVLCKAKKQNYFEAMAKYIPNVIVTVTADYKVHLWIESFAQSNVEFYKFEIINEFVADCAFPWCSFFDANDKESLHSHQRTDVIISKLMNPYSDRVYYLLKDANDMGVARINYPLTSNDWLCFITVSLFGNGLGELFLCVQAGGDKELPNKHSHSLHQTEGGELPRRLQVAVPDLFPVHGHGPGRRQDRQLLCLQC